MLKLLSCPVCGHRDILVKNSKGRDCCLNCYNHPPFSTEAGDNHFRPQIKTIVSIDKSCSLDMIGAYLMAFYIKNGMPVRQVARQLGINHATVYARLRKFDLIDNASHGQVVLNPNIGDFLTAGGARREFRVIQLTDYSKKRKER